MTMKKTVWALAGLLALGALVADFDFNFGHILPPLRRPAPCVHGQVRRHIVVGLVPAIGGLPAGIRIVLIACGLIQPDGVHAFRYTLAGVFQGVCVVRDFRFGQRVGLLAAGTASRVGVARCQQKPVLYLLPGASKQVRWGRGICGLVDAADGVEVVQ